MEIFLYVMVYLAIGIPFGVLHNCSCPEMGTEDAICAWLLWPIYALVVVPMAFVILLYALISWQYLIFWDDFSEWLNEFSEPK